MENANAIFKNISMELDWIAALGGFSLGVISLGLLAHGWIETMGYDQIKAVLKKNIQEDREAISGSDTPTPTLTVNARQIATRARVDSGVSVNSKACDQPELEPMQMNPEMETRFILIQKTPNANTSMTVNIENFCKPARKISVSKSGITRRKSKSSLHSKSKATSTSSSSSTSTLIPSSPLDIGAGALAGPERQRAEPESEPTVNVDVAINVINVELVLQPKPKRKRSFNSDNIQTQTAKNKKMMGGVRGGGVKRPKKAMKNKSGNVISVFQPRGNNF